MKLLWVQDPSYDWCRIVVMKQGLTFPPKWEEHHNNHNSDVEPYLLMYILWEHIESGGTLDGFKTRWTEVECGRGEKLNYDALWDAATEEI